MYPHPRLRLLGGALCVELGMGMTFSREGDLSSITFVVITFISDFLSNYFHFLAWEGAVFLLRLIK